MSPSDTLTILATHCSAGRGLETEPGDSCDRGTALTPGWTIKQPGRYQGGAGAMEPASVSGHLTQPLSPDEIHLGPATPTLCIAGLTWPSRTAPSTSSSCPPSCRKTGSPASLASESDRSRRTTAGRQGPRVNGRGSGHTDAGAGTPGGRLRVHVHVPEEMCWDPSPARPRPRYALS